MPTNIQAKLDAIDWDDPRYQESVTRILLQAPPPVQPVVVPDPKPLPEGFRYVTDDDYEEALFSSKRRKTVALNWNRDGVLTERGRLWTEFNVCAALRRYAKRRSNT